MYLIFFSNRRRHTICALVTGVQRVLFRSDGLFDLIFNFGLLYHLRHPLLALDKTRAVCRGAMILETHVVNAFGNLPASLFYRRDELVTSTNWTGPNDSPVVNWRMEAGSPYVFGNRPNYMSTFSMRIYVTCIDEAWSRKDNK